MTTEVTNVVVEVLPEVRGLRLSQRSRPASALGISDRPLSLHHRAWSPAPSSWRRWCACSKSRRWNRCTGFRC